jgi:predicted flap endonuclease-1-like 5' DNA nuclease
MDTFIDIVRLNLVPILIALLIGLVVGWWIFARPRRASPVQREVSPPPAPAEPIAGPGAGDSGVAQEIATAVEDVVGELVGVHVAPAIPEASGPPDNLQTLKGVGPRLAALLNDQGITRFDQLAALTPDQVERIDGTLGSFSGRLARDRVVEQAGYLARGDLDGFQARFGNLGGSA